MPNLHVYTFGGGKLIAGYEHVWETMWRAHRYRNRLTEIERNRRASVRDEQRTLESLAPLHGRVDAAKARLAELLEHARKTHADLRSRKTSAAQRAAIAEARADLRAAGEALKTAKAAATEELKPRYQAVEEKDREARLAARGASAVYHPTYQLVEAAAESSRKKLAKKLSPDDDPRFRPLARVYGGRVNADRDEPPFELAKGRIGVVTGGKRVTVAEAFSGEHAWLRISPIDPGAYHLPKGERKRATRACVSFRVGSNDDRTPIWATIDRVHFHRELPADGVIVMAWFKASMRGDRPQDRQWELQLTVRSDSAQQRTPDEHAKPGTVAAINLGWRALEDGSRRVAYVVDAEGDEQEITYAARARSRIRKGLAHMVPEDGGDRFAHADSLRAIRGRNFDAMRGELAAWLKSREVLPAHLADVTEHLNQWRSTSRLAALVRGWQRNRIAGDDEIVQRLVAWVHQDAHLYQWETRERERACRARREHYRLTARALCERYATIVIGDVDLGQLARRKPVEKAEDDATADQRRARARTAPSELVAAIKLVAPKFATRLVEIDAVDITRRCHVCGYTEAWDARSGIVHRCAACGSIWDQDANACRNLLGRLRERDGGGESPGGARSSGNSTDLVEIRSGARIDSERGSSSIKDIGGGA